MMYRIRFEATDATGPAAQTWWVRSNPADAPTARTREEAKVMDKAEADWWLHYVLKHHNIYWTGHVEVVG